MTAVTSVVNELANSLARVGQARRDDMLVKLSALFGGVSHLLDDNGIETFDAIFVSLLPVCSDTAKMRLADVIAAKSRGPGRSIRHLAFDDAIQVASPVIRLSPLLLDDHLLALATVKSLDHLLAICERSDIASGVTDIILSRANGEIRVALVSNPGAKFSPSGKLRVAEAALDDGCLYDAMLGRADLAEQLQELEGAPAKPKMPMPHEGRAVGGNPAGYGLPLDQALRDLLAAGSVDLALGMLAKTLNVPSRAVAKAFALDIHGGFLSYAKAANLNWQTTLRFIMKRYEAGQITPHVQRAEADYAKLSHADAVRVTHVLVQHAGLAH